MANDSHFPVVKFVPSLPQAWRGLTYSPEGDCVILKSSDETKTPIFISKLRAGAVKYTRWGDISHDSIIGKESRHVVSSKKFQTLRAMVPTLEDYTTLTPRLVTPVCQCLLFYIIK